MTKMTQPTQCSTSPDGNTKHSIRARIWSVVINNYTEDDITQWHSVLDRCIKYVWQYEKGETPHIQGHIVFKNAITFKSLKKQLPRAHIEKVRNIECSEKYCQKIETRNGETFMKGFEEKKTLKEKILEIEYKDIKWKDWQKKIIDFVEKPIDKRKILWIYSEEGDVGKSFICKYLCLKYDCIIANGKTDNIFNQLLQWRTKNVDEPQLPMVCVDIPRGEFSHINYGAIEQIKNGFIYSGKYEGGQIFGLSPHCIVFANTTPKLGQMSEDRWIILNVGEQL